MVSSRSRRLELQQVSIDDIDRKLLDMLREEGRASLAKLSRTVGLSKPTIKYRMDRLMQAGVIKSFFALVDSAAYGLKVSALFDLTVEPQAIQDVAAKLQRYPQVIRLYEISTGPELHVHALFTTNEEMEQFMRNSLYTIPGIRAIKTGLIMSRYKAELSLTI